MHSFQIKQEMTSVCEKKYLWGDVVVRHWVVMPNLHPTPTVLKAKYEVLPQFMTRMESSLKAGSVTCYRDGTGVTP